MEHQDAILVYPDPRLRQTSETITEITDEIRERAQAMFPIMYADNGIGLAAPQIGWHVRLFVVNVTGEASEPQHEFVIVNPEIVSKGGGTWAMEEGCLSLPGIRGKVTREKEIVIRGNDLDGEPIEISCDGLIARVILHEYDHLDGVLFIDRLSAAKKQSIKRRLKELEAAYEEQSAHA